MKIDPNFYRTGLIRKLTLIHSILKTLKQKTAGVLLGTLFLITMFNGGLKAQAGAALNFDGGNDYITTSTVSFGSNWTVEGWAMPTNTSSPYWNTIFGQCFYNNSQGFVVAQYGNTVFLDGPQGFNITTTITANVWIHLAVTYNNGIFAFYKNGLLIGTQTVSGYADASRPFYLGARTNNSGSGLSDPFQGNIDEVRIWTTTRSQCQVLSYMNCEIPTVATGLISNYHFNQGTYNATNTGTNTLTDASGYSHTGTLSNFAYTGLTSNWTAPGGVTTGSIIPFSPLPEINVKGNATSIVNGDMSPTTSDYTNFGTTGTRTFVIESLGTQTLNLGKPFFVGGNATEFTVTVPPSTLLAASTGTSGFVVAFTPTSLGVKTTTVYIYNSDCDEPFYTFAITATAVAGAALSFDGVDDYVETNANLAELGKGDFTIEAWIKTTYTAQGIVTCANNNGTWDSGEKCFYVNYAGRPYFVGWGNNYIQSNIAVNDGNWHHVAVVWDYSGAGTSGTGYIYVDGVNHTGGVGYAANNNNVGTFKIGKQNYGATVEAPNNFVGQMDEVRIWSRALCAPEIVNNMNCELPSPASQPGLTGYYHFNSGIAFGANVTVTTAIDNSSSAITGTLTNFGLLGEASNWYALGAVTTGSSCSIYLDSEINLTGNGVTIADGDLTPTTSDNTDFSAICINGSVTRTFSVQNLGTAALTVSSMTMTGADAASFSMSALLPASPIAAGNSATFAVTFTPSSAGTKTAVINISNSDCSEALYDVVVSGTCNALPVVSANTSHSVICNSFTTNVTGGGAHTYTWTGPIPATNGIAFSPTATANYTVTGTNTLTGCTSTNVAVLTITVNALPSLITSVASGSICAGTSATLSATGADTYTWSPGSLNGATIASSPAVTTTFTAFGTNTLTGCTSTNSADQTITVHITPTVTASTNNTTLCASSPATLTGSGTNTYTWNPGALSGPTINPVLSTTTIFTLTGSNLDGCMSATSSTVLITVNPLPTVGITPLITTICSGGTASLAATGADSYTWNPGGSTTGTLTVSPIALTSYTLIGGSLAGCSSTNLATQIVTVNAIPSVTAATTNATACAASLATLTASGANTYTWNPGALTGATINPVLSTTITYTLSGTSLEGCISTTSPTVLITVNPLPTVGITPLITTICAGATASLVATGADNYTWTPGGSISGTISPSPAALTNYTVIGQSLAGCSSTNLATQSVTVNALPTVTATASSTLVCNSETTALMGMGADTYTWNPGITNATSFTPSVTTSYTLSGSSALTGCTSTNLAVQTISVNVSPTISLVVSNATICAGSSPTLTASNASSYSWSPGNFTTAVISPTPASTTIYTLSGISAAGCLSSNTLTQVIFVNPIPLVTASAFNASVCEGYSTSLSGAGATGYSWSGGVTDGVSFTPIVTDTYTVTGIDANLCSNTATITIIVDPTPTITANITNTIVCQGASLLLSGNGASTYTWSGGITDNQAFVPAASGNYSLTGASLEGCTSSPSVVSVTVSPLPSVTAAASHSTICTGNLTTLSGNGAVTYTWSNGVADNIAFSPTLTDTYTVTGEDLNGCKNTATASIMVYALPILTGSSSHTIICSGETVTLSVSGASSYIWNTGESASTIVQIVNSTTNYTVAGTDLNGCSNTFVIIQAVSDCTGIENMQNNTVQFRVYPNPNNGTFVVESSIETDVLILNTTGQVILSPHLVKGKNKIDLRDNAHGIYFLKNKTSYTKIIKE